MADREDELDSENDAADATRKSIAELNAWLASPPGQYLLAWEQSRFDAAVADCFGYHALQLGLAQLDGLRHNRMPHRWLAVSTPIDIPSIANNNYCDTKYPVDSINSAQLDAMPTDFPRTLIEQGEGRLRGVDLVCAFNELPFESASLDLVVMPHALEFAPDSHATLREVERVLVPEGRIVVSGFNNWSLWGMRQALSRRSGRPYLPHAGEFIGYRRIKDWLRLLGFEFETGHFGCYRPPVRSQAWLDRMAFMDKAGDRWWPVLGAAYCMVAVKRVKGMRLITPVKRGSKVFVASGGLKPVTQSLKLRSSPVENGSLVRPTE